MILGLVSMPLNGLFSFLPHYIKTIKTAKEMCVNALKRALFISTKTMTLEMVQEILVSMPLNGLFSFLQYEKTDN